MIRMDVELKADKGCIQLRKNTEKIISVLCRGDIGFIYTTFDITEAESPGAAGSFLKWLKDMYRLYEKKYDVVFRCIIKARADVIRIRYIAAVKEYIRNIYIADGEGADGKCQKLMSRNIPCMIMLDNDDVRDIYEKGRKYLEKGIGIYTDALPNYSAIDDTLPKELFYSGGDCNISIMADLVSVRLMGEALFDCRHRSCLGRTLYIDEEGNISFCRHYDSHLTNLEDITDIGDIFHNDRFISLLTAKIEERKSCRNCPVFSGCGGGCPMEEQSSEGCAEYKNALAAASKEINKILASKDLTGVSPYIRSQILLCAAYNKLR